MGKTEAKERTRDTIPRPCKCIDKYTAADFGATTPNGKAKGRRQAFITDPPARKPVASRPVLGAAARKMAKRIADVRAPVGPRKHVSFGPMNGGMGSGWCMGDGMTFQVGVGTADWMAVEEIAPEAPAKK
eukprot:1181641-Prymnesium_polylepis.1